LSREWLYGADHSAGAIAIYIAICAVLDLVATALMSDYTGKDDIPGEYITRISGLISLLRFAMIAIRAGTDPTREKRR